MKFKDFVELIRIEHTLFSLPFAYSGALLVKVPTPYQAVLIFTALFGIRSFALIVNNVVDAEIDKLNPRTAKRPIPSGRVTKREAWLLALLSLLIYFVSAYLLNWYAFVLSPIFPIMAYVYPYIKRYIPVAHFWLGSILGGAVVGGAIAVSGDAPSLLQALLRVPWPYAVAVAFWVASFDALYAVMDVEFDKKHSLHSIPADLGIERGLKVAEASALLFVALSVWSVDLYSLGLVGALMTAMGIFLHSELFGKAKVDPLGAAKESLNTSIAVGLLVGGAPLVARLLALLVR